MRRDLDQWAQGPRSSTEAVQIGCHTPWGRRLGWANYLVDLGTWEDMLSDFGRQLWYRSISWRDGDLHVTLTDGSHERTLTLPLDGRTFSGATPAELAVDFLHADAASSPAAEPLWWRSSPDARHQGSNRTVRARQQRGWRRARRDETE